METANVIRVKENVLMHSIFRAASQSVHNTLTRNGSFDSNGLDQAHLYGERHTDRMPKRAVCGIVTVRKAASTSLAVTFTRHCEGNRISDVW